MAELRQAGMSFRRIVAELTRRGIRTMRGGAWTATRVRDEIADLIEESPSPADYPATQLSGLKGAYVRGRRDAAAETGFTHLPQTCPWTIEQVLDHGFWPEAPAP